MSQATALARELVRTLKELTQPKLPTHAEEPVQTIKASKVFKESLQTEKLKGLLCLFDCVYAHWKVDLKLTEKCLINNAPPSKIQEYVNALESNLEELSLIYNEYSDFERPTSHLRRRFYKCFRITKDVVQGAQAHIQATEGALRLKLEQLEAENLARKQAMEQIRQDMERLEVLKQALLPEVSLVDQGTSGSDSLKVNNTDVKVKKQRAKVKKPVAAKRPAATKKPKKVAAKKPAAKKVASPRRATKRFKKQTHKDHGRDTRKERRDFQEHRKKGLVRFTNVGGKNSRPPEKLLL